MKWSLALTLMVVGLACQTPVMRAAAAEIAPAAAIATVLKSGMLRNADRQHRGEGSVEILEAGAGRRILRLSNFKVTDGPDLKVWLVSKPAIQSARDVKTSKTVTLGALQKSTGSQDYELPASVNLDEFQSLVIWCEKYSVLFAASDLT